MTRIGGLRPLVGRLTQRGHLLLNIPGAALERGFDQSGGFGGETGAKIFDAASEAGALRGHAAFENLVAGESGARVLIESRLQGVGALLELGVLRVQSGFDGLGGFDGELPVQRSEFRAVGDVRGFGVFADFRDLTGELFVEFDHTLLQARGDGVVLFVERFEFDGGELGFEIAEPALGLRGLFEKAGIERADDGFKHLLIEGLAGSGGGNWCGKLFDLLDA